MDQANSRREQMEAHNWRGKDEQLALDISKGENREVTHHKEMN